MHVTLQYVASVLFTPLEPICFRWYGIYTWLATGPSSQAVSEPLPLPSTLLGALVYGLSIASNRFSDIAKGSAKSIDNLLKDLIELLKACGCSCSDIVLRGPYIVSQRGLALHIAGGCLLLIDGNNIEVVSPRRTVNRGTALRRDTKSVVQHMLYSIEYVDLIQILGEYSIAVDILCKESCKLVVKPIVMRLGSDGRAVKMSVDVLENSLAKNISKASSNLFYVASPVLVEPLHIETFINEGKIAIDNIQISSLSRKELEHILNVKRDTLIKHFRTKIQILATGYDILRNSLREMYPSIMPGSIIRINSIDKEKLLKGLGKYSHAGWGTIVPLNLKS